MAFSKLIGIALVIGLLRDPFDGRGGEDEEHGERREAPSGRQTLCDQDKPQKDAGTEGDEVARRKARPNKAHGDHEEGRDERSEDSEPERIPLPLRRRLCQSPQQKKQTHQKGDNRNARGVGEKVQNAEEIARLQQPIPGCLRREIAQNIVYVQRQPDRHRDKDEERGPKRENLAAMPGEKAEPLRTDQ